MTGDIRTADAWREKDPKTPEEVREYYQSANDYLYDLLQWNSEPLYQRVVEPLLQVSGRKVLSIGPGLGTECAMAMKGGNEVHAFELDGVLKDFLKFRFGDDVTLITWPPKEQYDVVTVIDVIEHIHPEEVRGFLATVDRAITPGGYLICHYTGPMSGIPQHFNNDAVYEEWIEGYTKIGEFLWRKHEDSHGEG